jgi:hypothetical protein
MSDNVYEVALNAAFAELQELKQQEREIALRKAKLQETLDALIPLVYPSAVDVNTLSLPNAMRLVLHSSGRPLSAYEFKTKLVDIGFDISKFDNPLANIHTAMNRMVENDEMIWIETEGKKKGIPGPDLKPVPQALPGPPEIEILKDLLERSESEKK